MTFHFGQLIAHICKTRNVRAGSVVGSGTVSNQGIEVNGKKNGPKAIAVLPRNARLKPSWTASPAPNL